jgi:hypothetical protein
MMRLNGVSSEYSANHWRLLRIHFASSVTRQNLDTEFRFVLNKSCSSAGLDTGSAVCLCVRGGGGL